MKTKNSIALKKLIIIITILLIGISLAVAVLIDTYKISKLEKYVSQMEVLQQKVNSVRSNYILWKDYNPNEPGNYNSYLDEQNFENANGKLNIYREEFLKIIKQLDEEKVKYWNNQIDINLTNYHYFSAEDLESKLKLEDFNYDVIINFYTGNIISHEGIKDIYLNKLIYRQYDSSLGNALKIVTISNNKIQAKVEVIENKGLQQKIKVTLEAKKPNTIIPDIMEVYYETKENDIKKKCTETNDYIYNYETKTATFTIDTSKEYSFIVEDTNYIQYPKQDLEIKLCNPPQLIEGMVGIYWDENGVEHEIETINDKNWYNYSKKEMKFANAKTEDGSYWVWIPRFANKVSKEIIDIEFINGNSFTSTNKKPLDGFKNNSAFEDEKKYTGFWVNKFQMNYNDQKAISKPGKTLTVMSQTKAKKITENYNPNSKMMNQSEYEAIILLSKYYGIEITNNLVHYAGGGTTETEFIKNTQYSSTNNCYGVYDLITSEKEHILEKTTNKEGRFRCVIK